MSCTVALATTWFLSSWLGPTPIGQELERLEPAATDEIERLVPVVFEGIVVDPEGAPAEGAVVASSSGGKAVTDRAGSYRLEASVPADARIVCITAVGGSGTRLVASTSVDLTTGSPLARVAPLVLSRQGACQPSWLPTFGRAPGVGTTVFALTAFDDGSGLALYAGGGFSTINGAANRIAKLDGTNWVPVGDGMDESVWAMAVFDDGSGPALYAGGEFTTAGGVAANHVAKWDGASWSTLGAGTNGLVRALTVFDDGGGPALYAGGAFTTAGGVAASNIAKWDGAGWSALLGGGTSGAVFALTAFDDGSGPALYAGGSFTAAGGMSASRVAKWDGASWTALGSGFTGGFLATWVNALTVFDDGGGPALYAGGNFTTAGGVAANYIAKWDGSSWAAFGSGMSGHVVPPPEVLSLTVLDDGSGPALYAGGYFLAAGSVTVNGITKWDGASWSALGSGTNGAVFALIPFDDGGGTALYAGGLFSYVGVESSGVAKWDGASWASLGSGLNNPVSALAAFDDGSGPALHAGGSFTNAGSVAAKRIAKWDGSDWTTLGSGVDSEVYGLTAFDDGSGPALYAGGPFTTAGGIAANHIAKWDGSTWAPVGGGMNDDVWVVAVFDDGSGPALYAGGAFTSAGGAAANHIAKWNGSSWASLGSGTTGPGGGFVLSLTVFDDGGGPALYAGGSFTTAGGIAANGIARWNGMGWSALGSGTGSVRALTAFDDGSGPALYAAVGTTLARWDGTSWSALGSGMNSTVEALTVFDDGSGPAIYAGGSFTFAGGTSARGIARWNGSSWTALGSGVFGDVQALTVFNDRTGPALYAGGFLSAPDSGDGFLAKWGCPDTNPPTITCPPGILVDDRRENGRGEVLTFTVTAVDAEDPTPSLVCVPPSGSFFPRGTTTVTCTATDFSGNQSTCQFTVTVRSKLREP